MSDDRMPRHELEKPMREARESRQDETDVRKDGRKAMRNKMRSYSRSKRKTSKGR